MRNYEIYGSERHRKSDVRTEFLDSAWNYILDFGERMEQNKNEESPCDGPMHHIDLIKLSASREVNEGVSVVFTFS